MLFQPEEELEEDWPERKNVLCDQDDRSVKITLKWPEGIGFLGYSLPFK